MYSFPLSVVAGLKSGDYSIQGHEDQIAIERKSHVDAYGSCGKGRVRFEAEVKRLSMLEYAAIVVEASLADIHVRPPFVQRMSGAAVRETLIGWSIKYGVPVHWAGDRRHGNALVKSLLEHWWDYNVEQTT